MWKYTAEYKDGLESAAKVKSKYPLLLVINY